MGQQQRNGQRILIAGGVALLWLLMLLITVRAAPLRQREMFDVAVEPGPLPTTIQTGQRFSLTITLRNRGPLTATGLLFFAELPSAMQSIAYDFSVPTVGGSTPYQWLIPQLGPQQTAIITLSGVLEMACEESLSSRVGVQAPGDVDPTNDSISLILPRQTDAPCIFLPLVQQNRPPTPIPTPQRLYYDDFTVDTAAGEQYDWPRGLFHNCRRGYDEGEYFMHIDDDDDQAERDEPQERGASCVASTQREIPFGSFQVTAYPVVGAGDFAYGLYINSLGTGSYYLFRIRLNRFCTVGSDWQLVRHEEEDSITKLISFCDPVVHVGLGARNQFKIEHYPAGQFRLYLNNQFLGSYFDPQPFSYEGMGLYARQSKNYDLAVRFDNFTVYKVTE